MKSSLRVINVVRPHQYRSDRFTLFTAHNACTYNRVAPIGTSTPASRNACTKPAARIGSLDRSTDRPSGSAARSPWNCRGVRTQSGCSAIALRVGCCSHDPVEAMIAHSLLIFAVLEHGAQAGVGRLDRQSTLFEAPKPQNPSDMTIEINIIFIKQFISLSLKEFVIWPWFRLSARIVLEWPNLFR